MEERFLRYHFALDYVREPLDRRVLPRVFLTLELFEITGYLGGYARYAELKLRVLITMPDRLAFSVLGRSDFFEQVDVTFAEFEKKLYFRFRDPAVLRSYA